MMAMLFGGWEILMILFVLGIFALGLLACVFWIWMLIDAIRNENISGNERVVWVLVIVLTHSLGALIYFFAARSRQPRLSPPPLPGHA